MAHYDDHPAYRNQAYVVGKKVKCGENRPNVPNWEVEVQRGTPWFGGTGLDSNEKGVNIAGVAYDWLTDDIYGLGLSDDELDQPSFDAVKATIDDRRISPYIAQQMDAEQAFSALFDYADLFLLPNEEGKLELGRWQTGNIDTSALPVIGSDDLTVEPETTNSGYEDTINQARVVFADRLHDYKDVASEPATDTSNFRIVGERRPVTLQRPWITYGDFANLHATEHVKAKSQPAIAGIIKVKRERVRALGIRPGKLFSLNAAAYGLTIVSRCLELEWPADRDGSCTLTIENERSIYPQLYVQPPAETPGNFIVEASAIQNARIWQLPSGLKTLAALQIAILAQKPAQPLVGFRVHGSVDEVVYDRLASQVSFSAFGRLTTPYPDTTADLDTVTGIEVELFGIDNIASQSDAARNNNTLLCVIEDEIMSVGRVTALGSGVYQVLLKRKLYGTEKVTHFVGATCWFILRSRLVRIANTNFIPGSTYHFKLQSYTAQQDYDLSLVEPIPYVFATGAGVDGIFALSLTTDARSAANGTVESHIYAEWDWVRDQDVFQFELRYKKTADTHWHYLTVQKPESGLAQAEFLVSPSTGYDVQVRAVNSHGEQGSWDDVATIISATIALFTISGLELVGQGNVTDFFGPDAKFDCRLNSPSRVGAIDNDPLTPGVQDPVFDHYEWEVYAGAVNAAAIAGSHALRLYTERTSDPHFEFTYGKNLEAASRHGATSAYPQFTVAVDAVDTLQQIGVPAVLTVQNPNPSAPTALTAVAAFKSAFLECTTSNDSDLAYTEVLRSLTNNVDDAVVIGHMPPRGLTFTAQVSTGVQTWFWVRSVDTFGNKSNVFPAGAGVSIIAGQVAVTDIEDFAIDATKMFTNTVVLQADVWTNNSPTAGKIAWNAHQLYHQGVAYNISGSNTALEFVYWTVGNSSYTASATKPTPSDTIFMIAWNKDNAGVSIKVWNSIANAVIGSANILNAAVVNAKIANLAVDDAKIANVSADKIVANSILSVLISIATGGVIESDDYVSGGGGTGFHIERAYAEFQKLITRDPITIFSEPTPQPSPNSTLFETSINVTIPILTGLTGRMTRDGSPVNSASELCPTTGGGVLTLTDDFTILRVRYYRTSDQRKFSDEALRIYALVPAGTGGTGVPPCATPAIIHTGGRLFHETCQVQFHCAIVGATIHYVVSGGSFGTWTSGDINVPLGSIVTVYGTATGYATSETNDWENFNFNPEP